MVVKPSPTLATRIRELGTLADFADKLDEPVDSVSDTFLHPPEHHLHIIIELPSAGGSSSLLSPSCKCIGSPASDQPYGTPMDIDGLPPDVTNNHSFKRPRSSSQEKKWNLNGAMTISDASRYYYIDPAKQEANDVFLHRVMDAQFVLLSGARASGKTTRLKRMMEQLRALYLCA
jgi:hypothetical protein